MNIQNSLPNSASGLPRRSFLTSLSSGLAGISLASLLQDEQQAQASSAHVPPDGNAHFPPKAKSVIWMFMRGGVSHMESFDPKPMLTKYAGSPLTKLPGKVCKSLKN